MTTCANGFAALQGSIIAKHSYHTCGSLHFPPPQRHELSLDPSFKFIWDRDLKVVEFLAGTSRRNRILMVSRRADGTSYSDMPSMEPQSRSQREPDRDWRNDECK